MARQFLRRGMTYALSLLLFNGLCALLGACILMTLGILLFFHWIPGLCALMGTGLLYWGILRLFDGR